MGACLFHAAKAAGAEPAMGAAEPRAVAPSTPVRVADLGHYDGMRLAQAAHRQEPAAAPPQEWSGSLAVIYPDIPEPYRSVFLQIIEGVEDLTKSKVRAHAVGPKVDAAEFNAELRRNNTKVVIALGRQGLKVASTLPQDIAVTVGGVLSLPEAEQRNLSGISLTPDPALLFSKLKGLQPAMRRVWVVYDPKHNEWLIRMAKEAAKAQGLELKAIESNDLAEAIKAYEQLFAAADPKRDAVWLPQDPTTADEQTVLPLVLKESWQRNMPVFSSNYQHVKKGALFVLYPNNLELGRSLALSAFKGLSGDGRKGVLPLREVFAAINLRTANHMGLNISIGQQRGFDSVFP